MSLSMLQRRVMPGPPELLVRGAGVLAVVSCLDPVPGKDIRNCRAAAVALEDLVNRQPAWTYFSGSRSKIHLHPSLQVWNVSPRNSLRLNESFPGSSFSVNEIASWHTWHCWGKPWKNMRLPPASTRWCFSHVGRWWVSNVSGYCSESQSRWASSGVFVVKAATEEKLWKILYTWWDRCSFSAIA